MTTFKDTTIEEMEPSKSLPPLGKDARGQTSIVPEGRQQDGRAVKPPVISKTPRFHVTVSSWALIVELP